MEKYAVVTETDKNKVKDQEKTAGVKNDQARRHSNVPISDTHGTSPWERQHPGKNTNQK